MGLFGLLAIGSKIASLGIPDFIGSRLARRKGEKLTGPDGAASAVTPGKPSRTLVKSRFWFIAGEIQTVFMVVMPLIHEQAVSGWSLVGIGMIVYSGFDAWLRYSTEHAVAA